MNTMSRMNIDSVINNENVVINLNVIVLYTSCKIKKIRTSFQKAVK